MAEVSVALATYNGAHFVAEQVGSILEQQPPVAQLVVADDGSTDGTVDLVRAAHAPYRDVTELTVLDPGPTRGTVANFSRAIMACTGDLIALADQDDRWHPGRIDTAVRHFDADPGLLLVHSDARLIDAVGRPFGAGLFAELGITKQEFEQIAGGRAFDAYLRRNLVTGATTMFRRALREQALPVPEGWLHDEWLAIVASAIGGVAAIQEELIDYRQHGTNQVGVQERTLRYRFERMLVRRADRFEKLDLRASSLPVRLAAIGAAPALVEAAQRKADFERSRNRYPARRLSRIRPVLAQLGEYRRFSSQGRLDPLRDLLQPA